MEQMKEMKNNKRKLEKLNDENMKKKILKKGGFTRQDLQKYANNE